MNLVVLLAAGSLWAAPIVVGPNVQVSQARAGIPHLEVVMAADPNHVERLIACSMLRGEGSDTNSAAYVSFDRGKTWSAPVLAPEKFADDPTCAYGPDGTVYFIAKTETRYPRHGSDWDALYIRRSRDGGKTWDPVIPSVLANDRPFMAVDTTNGKYRGRLYISYNQHVHGETDRHTPDDFRNMVRFATSLDGGNNFRYIYDRALLDQGGDKTAASLTCAVAILSDSTVAVLHQHGVMGPQRTAGGKLHEESSRLQVFLSSDGGESFDPPVKIADVHSSYNLPNSRGVVANMAVDASGGRFQDRLYAVWTDVSSGRSEIYLSYSADKGKTWSKPKRVNDDQKADRTSGGPDNFMPAIVVNRAGLAGITWYDRRDNPDNLGYYVRFSASLDGGETPSVRVSEAPNSVPKQKGPLFPVTGGDTAGLAADAGGVFHALWIDNRSGVQQVWTAAVTVESTGK